LVLTYYGFHSSIQTNITLTFYTVFNIAMFTPFEQSADERCLKNVSNIHNILLHNPYAYLVRAFADNKAFLLEGGRSRSAWRVEIEAVSTIRAAV
jgi:hypothetical protein